MIINIENSYNFNTLENNIKSLTNTYSFLRTEIIGYSVLGRPLYSLIIGNGTNHVFYFGSIHANEWIVSLVLMKFIEDFCIAYTSNSKIFGNSAENIFNNSTLHITPMANPDGVDLVNNSLNKNSDSYIFAKNISNRYPDIPFPSGWKANINGVDLNLQFPAGWENAKKIKYSQGFTSPAPRDFVGIFPLSEPESLALYNYTKSNNFNLIITYHTQGKEIYWQFKDYAPRIAYEIGLQFAKVSGYTLADVPYVSSFAGYKDWFLQEYSKPAYTIEAGIGENPLPISQFNEIYKDNLGILVLGTMYQKTVNKIL